METNSMWISFLATEYIPLRFRILDLVWNLWFHNSFFAEFQDQKRWRQQLQQKKWPRKVSNQPSRPQIHPESTKIQTVILLLEMWLDKLYRTARKQWSTLFISIVALLWEQVLNLFFLIFFLFKLKRNSCQLYESWILLVNGNSGLHRWGICPYQLSLGIWNCPNGIRVYISIAHESFWICHVSCEYSIWLGRAGPKSSAIHGPPLRNIFQTSCLKSRYLYN